MLEVITHDKVPSEDHFRNESHTVSAISDSGLPSLHRMPRTDLLIVAQSFRESVLDRKCQREKGFPFLLPCPLLLYVSPCCVGVMVLPWASFPLLG